MLAVSMVFGLQQFGTFIPPCCAGSYTRLSAMVDPGFCAPKWPLHPTMHSVWIVTWSVHITCRDRQAQGWCS